MKWFLKWRLRRAEEALTNATMYREACEATNERYGGEFLNELLSAAEAEHCAEQRVTKLKQRLERRS